MNAPFQARAGLRDPFTAFVCDDATADMTIPLILFILPTLFVVILGPATCSIHDNFINR